MSACVLFAVGVESASAYIYWSDANNGTIGRANLDGTSPNETFITTAVNFPLQVAVNDSNIFWANQNGNAISRADLDGSDASQIVTGVTTSRGVALNSSNLFWSGPSGSTIVRGALDGTSSSTIVGTASSAFYIAVSDSYLFWSRPNNNVIGRANLDGTSPNTAFIAGNSPQGVAVYGDYVYWLNSGSDSIGRVKLDGTSSNPTFIAGLASGGRGIGVDAEHIYWTNFATGNIGRADLDGNNVNASFRSTSGSPRSLAIDTPVFHVTPTSKDFGGVVIGTTSSSQSFVITNNGGGPLGMPVVSLTGVDAGLFNITGNTCSSNLDPAETCTVTVDFSPASTGVKSANLKFDYLGGPYGSAMATNVGLGGTGQPQPAPELEISPTSKDFGSQTVGSSSAETFTITNAGDATLTIGALSLGGSGASEFALSADGCSGQAVAALATCTVTTNFSPTSTGSSTSTLTIPSNASGSPETVVLSGAAVAALIPSDGAATVPSAEAPQTSQAPQTTPSNPLIGSPFVLVAKSPGGKDSCVIDTSRRKSFSVPYALSPAGEVEATLYYRKRSSALQDSCKAGPKAKESSALKIARKWSFRSAAGSQKLKIMIQQNGRKLASGRYKLDLAAIDPSTGARSKFVSSKFFMVAKRY